MSYPYELEKWRDKISNKHICPRCKKRTFVRYVPTDAELPTLGEDVGKCDRKDKCDYHKTPKEYFIEHPEKSPWQKNANRSVVSHASKPIVKPAEQPAPPKPIWRYDPELMQSTMRMYHANNFALWLESIFGREEALRLLTLYLVGTSRKWSGANIFWQVDAQLHIRGGKIMLYNAANGKRVKKPFNYISWVHVDMPVPDTHRWEQCLFGSHLLSLYPYHTVGIVESEKTAIICTHFMPQIVWLATGGKSSNLKPETCECLRGRKVILVPDLGSEQEWSAKLPMLRSIAANVELSAILTDNATEEQRRQGLDIADFLLQKETPQMILNSMIARHPYLQKFIDDLDLHLVEDTD